MEVRYTILTDKSGILRTRNKMISDDKKITLVFDGAVPDNATVIIKDVVSGDEYYRNLIDGRCDIDTSIISTERTIRPYVTVLDETYKDKMVICEAIRITVLDNEKLLISDEADFVNIVNNLIEDNNAMREEIQSVREQLDKLKQTFSDMMEGYDISI